MSARRPQALATGPGGWEASRDDGSIALSAAITAATQRRDPDTGRPFEGSYYVRDEHDAPYARIDYERNGWTILGPAQLAEEGRRLAAETLPPFVPGA